MEIFEIIIDFLEKHWFGILGILIGAGLSFYFYEESNSPPRLSIFVDPIRTPIIDSSRFSSTTLRVLRPNGTEIKSDVTATKFYIWNNGRGSIKSTEILEPLLISIKDHNSVVLDYKILKVSRNVVKPVITGNPVDPNRSLMLSFSILEPEDGFTGQIIYEGPPKVEFSISGTIEKIRRITTNTKMRDSVILTLMVMYIVMPIVMLGHLLFQLFYQMHRNRRRLRELELDGKEDSDYIMRHYLKNRREERKRLFFTSAALIGVIFMSIYAISYLRKEASGMIIRNIPSSILP
jgi:hypothetical protein